MNGGKLIVLTAPLTESIDHAGDSGHGLGVVLPAELLVGGHHPLPLPRDSGAGVLERNLRKRAGGIFRDGADLGTESGQSRRQPQFGRPPDEVELRVDPQLGVDAAEMALHRPFPDEEPFGDLLGGESLSGQAGDVPLSPGE